MTNDNFAIFIISHGRPNDVITYKTLKKLGYNGRLYILCDDLDKTIEDYRKNFGDIVLVFDKKKIAEQIDRGDNFEGLRSTIFARNAIYEVANNLNIEYILVLDDDYNQFKLRFNKDFKFGCYSIDINKTINSFVTYLASTSIDCLCFSQGGDFFGGENGQFGSKIIVKRKAMNAFFLKVKKPVYFFGRLNEDVNTYIVEGSRGKLFFTISLVMLNQIQTQKTKGGMTEAYQKFGTYSKSFYSVMYQPSSVKIGMIKSKFTRIHHSINWNTTVPKILDPIHKK